MRNLFSILILCSAVVFPSPDVEAEPKVVCEDGMCRLVEDDNESVSTNAMTMEVSASRLALGYMGEKEFLAFLSGESRSAGFADFSDMGIALMLFAVLLGGLMMNLTPCVLPMMPVNLMIIGKSARRGAFYGLGITLAYGALGLAAAFGSLAFGEIQGSAWFNLGVSVVFAVLAFSLSGVIHIDFSRFRTSASGLRGLGDFYAFFMGSLSAVMAGACVAPVLMAVLLLTADLYGKGNIAALALPFVMGLGMALPWPFAGAGMKVLPKPGAWMKWVNRIFAATVFAFAFWYARLAYIGFTASSMPSAELKDGAIAMTPDNFSLEGLKRPVLVDCWASWCKNCSAMDSIMARPKVARQLQKFTLVKLQAEDMSKLVKLPGFAEIKGLPAFAVFE
jgi:thiol:disulfide interchange protein